MFGHIVGWAFDWAMARLGPWLGLGQVQVP